MDKQVEEPTYDGIPALIARINHWAIRHGLDKGNPKIEWMKVTEEVGGNSRRISKTQ